MERQKEAKNKEEEIRKKEKGETRQTEVLQKENTAALPTAVAYLANLENFRAHGGPLAKATSPTSAKLIAVTLVL